MSAPVDGMTDAARAAVAELLDLRGQPIILLPAKGAAIEKPSGGRDYAPAAPRPSQILAKFKQTTLDGTESAQSDRSTVRRFRFDLIGAYDAVVRVGDTWEDFAAKYVVDSVDVSQAYQVKAAVIGFLKDPVEPTPSGSALPFTLPVTLGVGGG